MVQWLRFHARNAGSLVSIQGWGIKVPHATIKTLCSKISILKDLSIGKIIPCSGGLEKLVKLFISVKTLKAGIWNHKL